MSGTLENRIRQHRTDNDEHVEVGPSNSDQNGKKCRGRKVKTVSLYIFRKINNKRRQWGCLGGGCGGDAAAGAGEGGGGDGKCFRCLKRPMTLGSPSKSPTSDPNSLEFSHDMLRGLIENNDFCDKDCNTHLLDDFDVYREIS